MTDKSSTSREPQGFTPRSGRQASEYAREQGWQMNEEERTSTPKEKQPYDGGTDYDYGAQDFGDTAQDTSSAKVPASGKAAAKADAKPQGKPARKKKAA